MSSIPRRINSERSIRRGQPAPYLTVPPGAQIEHWAKLGRVLDRVLSGESLSKVKQMGGIDRLDETAAFSQTAKGQ
jgi:hypothetical protein